MKPQAQLSEGFQPLPSPGSQPTLWEVLGHSAPLAGGDTASAQAEADHRLTVSP